MRYLMTTIFSFLPNSDWVTPARASQLVIAGIVIVVIGLGLGIWGIIKTPIETKKDDSLILLGLLDDVYQRLKLITRLTIRKMRSKKWENVTSAYPTLMGLADIDIEDAIETIMVKNVYLITTGKPNMAVWKLLILKDSKTLKLRIENSSRCMPTSVLRMKP